jgi:hypothetical protein
MEEEDKLYNESLKKDAESVYKFNLFDSDNNFLEISSVATKSFEDLNTLDLDLNFLSHKKN